MHLKRKYKEIFMIMETCEGQSMFDDITAPNLILFSTSKYHESAYTDEKSSEHNRFLNERWIKSFMSKTHEGVWKPHTKLADFMDHFTYEQIGQTVNFKDTLVGRDFKDVELREWWPMRDH
jgi:phosphatidylinositol glycan class K